MQLSGAVGVAVLPAEIWIDVLSRLSGQDLGRALCTCKAFAQLQQPAWKSACFRRWSKWSTYVDPSSQWRRQYELLCLRELAEGSVADPQRIRSGQSFITDRHRTVLVEWMCEVRGQKCRVGGAPACLQRSVVR